MVSSVSKAQTTILYFNVAYITETSATHNKTFSVLYQIAVVCSEVFFEDTASSKKIMRLGHVIDIPSQEQPQAVRRQ